ncbi:TPA: hypothetical protein EYP70_01765 [Candidatus Bathyarchaeota archaeon]|nr:hypothetical protein [Candidatus Bathyarchaeota archaeon]
MENLILLTTSRRPTRKIRTFLHDLTSVIPRTFRINRGKSSLEDLAEEAASRGLKKVIVIDRWKGEPGRIRLFKTGATKLIEVIPRIYIRGIKLQREFGVKKRPKVRLLHIRKPKVGGAEAKKFVASLSNFIEVPVVDGEQDQRCDAELRLSLDEEKHFVITFFLSPQGVEIGPRIRISHLIWSV